MRLHPKNFSSRALLAAAAGLVCIGATFGVILARDDGNAPSDRPKRITVFAAASLTDVLPAIDDGPKYSFGGSNSLATQIANGAPVDVFLSANTTIPEDLYKRGLVERPVVFTRNALVVVVPKGNPRGIERVEDLSRPGTKIVVAAPDVPVGKYTHEVLERLHLADEVEENVVSHETDVRGVLAKIQLGQGDAGFVYATDAKAVADAVETIDLPAGAQPQVDYAVAITSASKKKHEAQAFVNELRGSSAQTILAHFGFRPLASRPRAGLP